MHTSAGPYRSQSLDSQLDLDCPAWVLGIKVCALGEQSILLTDEHLPTPQRNSSQEATKPFALMPSFFLLGHLCEKLELYIKKS